MAKLRLSLTLPGAVSLGSYEGGALAALLVATQALGDDVLLVDSIASVSAGSMTGVLAARCLLRGADPVLLMRQAWVDLVSIQTMETHSTDSPLSSAALSGIADHVFGPGKLADATDKPAAAWRTEPVHLSMALASLAGLRYDLPVHSGESIPAGTYLDWYTVAVTSDQGSDAYMELAEAALASGANAIGFPPKLIDRSSAKESYERDGYQGFPADGKLWYTDGGTVNNEPLGRTIDLAQDVDSDDERLYVLIHPDPAAPNGQAPPVWSGDSPLPPWLKTATRAFSISRSQTIFEDLRRLEKTNAHLAEYQAVSAAVLAGIAAQTEPASTEPASTEPASTEPAGTEPTSAASEPAGPPKLTAGQAAAVESAIRAAIAARLGALPQPPEGGVPADLAGAIDTLVEATTGLGGKDLVSVEVVSPLVDPTETRRPAELLAGVFLFHFGGFFDVKYRQSDFALGYRNMQYWLANRLPAYLDGVDLAPALQKVNDAYQQLGWDDVHFGGATLDDLSLTDKARLARLVAHVLHVVAHDLHAE